MKLMTNSTIGLPNGRKKYTRKKDIAPKLANKDYYKYKVYKNRASKKNIIFDFTPDEFIEITSKSCEYCGFEGKMGIDRIDSKQGYVKNNTVPCCSICNIMKYTHSTEFFLNHIERIINHQTSLNAIKMV